jgi:Zn-dependent protease with chaperone function
VWLIVAWLLLDTTVPDLSLPHIDPDSTFGAATVARAVRYERFVRWNWALSQVALLIVLGVYAKKGVAFVRQSAAGRIGTGMLLGMLGLALVWLSQLPFGLAQHWWDRRYGLTSQSYLSWAFDGWGQLGAEFLSICLALLIVMAIAGKLPSWWWLPGALVFVAIGVAFQFGIPYVLTMGTKPLTDPKLVAAGRADERTLGLPQIPIRVEEVSQWTDAANAYAVGLGPSRRVVLWDTLLKGGYAAAEINAVLAHELGHHSSKHLSKELAWFALFAIPGTFVIARVTRRRGGMALAEAVPLGLLVVTVLSLLVTPVQNWISRRMEAEADWKSLQTTRDPQAMQSLFIRFSKDDLEDPSPPTWDYLLLEGHPTLAQRVAMARAWATRNP